MRPSVVFGPNDAMFNRLAGIAAHAPFVPLVGKGTARVQPVYVSDVGDAVAAVLARPDTAQSVFELGGPNVYTYRQVAEVVLHEIGRKKPIIGLPAGLMKLGGWFAGFLPVPPITQDQADLMTRDSVVRAGALSFATLGIQPTAPEAILPDYLDRFRVGGRYNQSAPA
jgi:NADH dehydrogenase